MWPQTVSAARAKNFKFWVWWYDESCYSPTHANTEKAWGGLQATCLRPQSSRPVQASPRPVAITILASGSAALYMGIRFQPFRTEMSDTPGDPGSQLPYQSFPLLPAHLIGISISRSRGFGLCPSVFLSSFVPSALALARVTSLFLIALLVTHMDAILF